MKLRKSVTRSAVAALLLVSAPAFAEPSMGGHGAHHGGDGDMMGHGAPMMGDMMGGNGMMGHGGGHTMGGMGGGMGAVWSVGLSDAQRKQVRDIMRDLRKKTWDIKGKIADESDQLWELYEAEKLDVAKISAVYSKMFDLRRQTIEESLKAKNKVYELLDEKQRGMMKQRMWQWGWQSGGH